MSNDLIIGDGSGPVSVQLGDGSGYGGRRGEIERIMAKDRDRYFREGLDQELAELRAAEKDNFEPYAPGQPLVPGRALHGFHTTAEGRELASAWQSAPGGFNAALATVQRDVSGLLQGIGDERHQAAFIERFDREVSERARYHIYDALRTGSRDALPATPAEIQLFGSTDVGADLIREWGSRAAVCVGRCLSRTKQFRESLDSGWDYESFIGWYDRLKPAELKAVLRHIARA